MWEGEGVNTAKKIVYVVCEQHRQRATKCFCSPGPLVPLTGVPLMCSETTDAVKGK